MSEGDQIDRIIHHMERHGKAPGDGESLTYERKPVEPEVFHELLKILGVDFDDLRLVPSKDDRLVYVCDNTQLKYDFGDHYYTYIINKGIFREGSTLEPFPEIHGVTQVSFDGVHTQFSEKIATYEHEAWKEVPGAMIPYKDRESNDPLSPV